MTFSFLPVFKNISVRSTQHSYHILFNRNILLHFTACIFDYFRHRLLLHAIILSERNCVIIFSGRYIIKHIELLFAGYEELNN